ncbi:hypothetical protein RHMOL_Rhmol11G0028100 [Rhododendron molle]|uniref:Uncharacterized protein n=1 Tax=Rhododendron molle TaxID=49168 RepID=A0ACC0LNY8_RHOML|nr:hypothetical protein RHMOL_Rhmol11G0028100 [Rhododendron molle]
MAVATMVPLPEEHPSSTKFTSGRSIPPPRSSPPGGASLLHKIHLQEEQGLLHNTHFQEEQASSTNSASGEARPPPGTLHPRRTHGFKSLTTSRIVPRFTRPVTDMIDGLWVSCDRMLMRQPALRLGVIIYWAFLHALLTTFVV